MELSNYEIEKIYLEYVNMVYKICFMIVKNTVDAEDAVQEVFVKLLRCKKKIKDGAHLKAWLIRTAQTTAIDMVRRKNDSPQPNDMNEAAAIAYDDREEIDSDIAGVVQKLPSKYITPIYLYYYEDYSYKEIARILNLPVSTIKMRMHYAKKMMKSIMEDDADV